MSSVDLFELWYGVAKSSRREFKRKRLEVFLAGLVHPLPFEDVDTELAGANFGRIANLYKLPFRLVIRDAKPHT